MNRGGDPGLQVIHVQRRLFGDDDVLEPGAAQQIIANFRHGGPHAVKKQTRSPRRQHPRPYSLSESAAMIRAQISIDVNQRFHWNEKVGAMEIDARRSEKLSVRTASSMRQGGKHEGA